MFFLLLEFCEIKCVYLFTVLYLLKIYCEGGGMETQIFIVETSISFNRTDI